MNNIMPSIKKTKLVFGAKVPVTKKDAKKLAPLTRYWRRRFFWDNWFILAFGAFLGFILGKISSL